MQVSLKISVLGGSFYFSKGKMYNEKLKFLIKDLFCELNKQINLRLYKCRMLDRDLM